MKRFLIEVSHEAERMACIRAIRILQETGSHYLTHADYGCMDGVHKAWIIVEVDSKGQARNILPPVYRMTASITALNRFTPEQLDALMEHHEG